jgi:hypothetical protein
MTIFTLLWSCRTVKEFTPEVWAEEAGQKKDERTNSDLNFVFGAV